MIIYNYYANAIPSNILRLIKERGFKQKTVVQWIGFIKQQFCSMLNGRKAIRVEYTFPIADALGVSIGELYDSGAAGNTM